MTVERGKSVFGQLGHSERDVCTYSKEHSFSRMED